MQVVVIYNTIASLTNQLPSPSRGIPFPTNEAIRKVPQQYNYSIKNRGIANRKYLSRD